MRLFALSTTALAFVGLTSLALAGDPAFALSGDNTKIEFLGTKPGGKHAGGFKKLTGTASVKGADPTTLKIAIDSVNSIGTQTKTEIRYVQSNGGPCTADPAWRATVGGVQRILDAGNPGGDQSKAGSGPASPVRGASAPRPK